MSDNNNILKINISEQIALEEDLCKTIDEQIFDINGKDYDDAKILLIKTRNILERHFTTLNELLDKLEQNTIDSQKKSAAANGAGSYTAINLEQRDIKISKILKDDYSALNHVTISNTLLHTTALALSSDEVADTALKHLENLAPFVVRIGKLLPLVITRELHSASPAIDLSIAETAIKNTKQAWKRAS